MEFYYICCKANITMGCIVGHLMGSVAQDTAGCRVFPQKRMPLLFCLCCFRFFQVTPQPAQGSRLQAAKSCLWQLHTPQQLLQRNLCKQEPLSQNILCLLLARKCFLKPNTLPTSSYQQEVWKHKAAYRWPAGLFCIISCFFPIPKENPDYFQLC